MNSKETEFYMARGGLVRKIATAEQELEFWRQTMADIDRVESTIKSLLYNEEPEYQI